MFVSLYTHTFITNSSTHLELCGHKCWFLVKFHFHSRFLFRFFFPSILGCVFFFLVDGYEEQLKGEVTGVGPDEWSGRGHGKSANFLTFP